MLDTNEISSVIIQILISNNNKEMTVNEIADEVSFPMGEILASLNTLIKLGILKKYLINDTDKNKFYYVLKKDITALEITKCSHQGIDLFSFSFFDIDNKEKETALELSSQLEKVVQMSENDKKPLIMRHKIMKQFITDDISSNLVLFYELTNNYVMEYLFDLAKKDPILKNRLEQHEHAEQELIKFLEANKKI